MEGERKGGCRVSKAGSWQGPLGHWTALLCSYPSSSSRNTVCGVCLSRGAEAAWDAGRRPWLLVHQCWMERDSNIIRAPGLGGGKARPASHGDNRSKTQPGLGWQRGRNPARLGWQRCFSPEKNKIKKAALGSTLDQHFTAILQIQQEPPTPHPPPPILGKVRCTHRVYTQLPGSDVV